MTQSPTQTLLPVSLKVKVPQNGWVTVLEIPYDIFPVYSSKHRRWLDYLGYAITGSDGILYLSSEITDGAVACDLDLPVSSGEVYFFHANGRVAFIDPYVITTLSSHSSCSRDSDFRPALIERDRRCVFTGTGTYQAAHLLAFRKGDEYIERLTEVRSGGQLVVDSINDPRNGLLLGGGIHSHLDHGQIAFLPTPVRSLKSCDVAGADDAEPDIYRLTIQSFGETSRIRRSQDHGLEAMLSSPLPDDWPPELILTALYAGAAMKAWGPSGSAELLSKITDKDYYREGIHKRGTGQDGKERERERQAKKEAQDQQRAERREAREQRRGLHGTGLDALDMVAILWELNNGPAWERAKRAAEAEAKQRTTEKVAGWLKGH
ncbi:hypothetical protein WOLCODRAFT_141162 [Wolfiporia cocos MD-104 SS10]|uniref:HNH nuclease domain-containing protein n=1 Tax=Wolfiporia cocos (strain MD-104) TaxID=742152 RepID=A0A2H3JND4_WOLCO|nr:hypothetical protein WOLCODRAFT_141162 [Wolfiporia cocos MD-104 SS10]